MKYRILSDKELKEMKPEFIKFLASNQVTADDWEKLKEHDSEKAEGLIEIFSDIVLDKVLTNINLIETRTRDSVQYFTFDDTDIQMTGIRVVKNSHIDLRKENSAESLQESINEHGGNLQLLSASKKLEKSENEEKFNMLEKNCTVCKDRSLYNTLQELIEKKEK